MPPRMHPQRAFRRRTAATRIQRAWRSRKFSRNVKKVVTSLEPYKYHIQSTQWPNEGPTNVGANPTTNLIALSNIPYNTQSIENQRSSTKVLAKNLRIRAVLRANTDAYSRIRLMVVRSKRSQNAGNVDQFANMPDDDNLWRRTGVSQATGTLVPQDAINAFPNTRFVEVLWDKTFQLGTFAGKMQTTATAQPVNYTTSGNAPHKSSLFVEKYIKLNKILKFNAVSDPASGTEYDYSPYNNQSYYLVAVSNSSSTPNPTVNAISMLSFKDLD
jgi:hypothetical protein